MPLFTQLPGCRAVPREPKFGNAFPSRLETLLATAVSYADTAGTLGERAAHPHRLTSAKWIESQGEEYAMHKAVFTIRIACRATGAAMVAAFLAALLAGCGGSGGSSNGSGTSGGGGAPAAGAMRAANRRWVSAA